ncbi:MAG: nuclear transport factor 2 family protein [Candidatus Omnitrophota bacterium]
MKKIIAIIFAFAVSVICVNVYAQEDASLGETLERQMWEDIKAGKAEMYVPKIADAFQSVHEDGMRNREQEIKLFGELKLGDCKLSKFNVTRYANTIIVTYLVQVAKETIGAKQFSDTPTPRLSVWIKTEKGWQWLAHANLNVAKK